MVQGHYGTLSSATAHTVACDYSRVKNLSVFDLYTKLTFRQWVIYSAINAFDTRVDSIQTHEDRAPNISTPMQSGFVIAMQNVSFQVLRHSVIAFKTRITRHLNVTKSLLFF